MYKIIFGLAISTIFVYAAWHDDDIYEIKYHYKNKAILGTYEEKYLTYLTNPYKLTPHPIFQLQETTFDRNSDGIVNTIVNYTHDKKGNILTKIVYDIQDDSKTKIDSNTYQYNAHNDILKITDYAGTYSFTYDQLNNLVKDNAYGYDIIYTYTSTTISTHSVGSSTAIIYTYNSQNKIIRIHAEEDGVPQGDGRIFTYDSEGNMISDISSAWKSNYNYNGNNQIISSRRQDIQYGTSSYDTYIYNNSGQLTKRIHNDDGPNESYTQTFIYNTKKQLIRDIYDVNTDNNIEIDKRYFYDTSGNVIKIKESGTYGAATYNFTWKDTRKKDYSWLSAIYNILLN